MYTQCHCERVLPWLHAREMLFITKNVPSSHPNKTQSNEASVGAVTPTLLYKGWHNYILPAHQKCWQAVVQQNAVCSEKGMLVPSASSRGSWTPRCRCLGILFKEHFIWQLSQKNCVKSKVMHGFCSGHVTYAHVSCSQGVHGFLRRLILPPHFPSQKCINRHDICLWANRG